MSVKPIKPREVIDLKKELLPEEVVLSFNELIAERFDGNRATFLLKDVLERIISKGLDEAEIFNNHWLDVEPVFRKEGWVVEIDKPGYNESYPSSFTFKLK